MLVLAAIGTRALVPSLRRPQRTRRAARPALGDVDAAGDAEEEPDLAELKNLFENTHAPPRARPDGSAATVDDDVDDDDDDDGDLMSLFAPPAPAPVDAAARAAFVDKLDLEGLVDEEYGRAANAMREAAAAERAARGGNQTTWCLQAAVSFMRSVECARSYLSEASSPD